MAATGAIAALKKRKERKRKGEIKYCPVCKKETPHEQMFKACSGLTLNIAWSAES